MTQSVLRRLGAAIVLIIMRLVPFLILYSLRRSFKLNLWGSGAAPADPGVAPIFGAGSCARPATAGRSGSNRSRCSIKIGDTTIIPIGFMDLTNTFRSTNSGASLATNFGNIPYNNAGFASKPGRAALLKIGSAWRTHASDFAWMRRSRIRTSVAYFEGDFVGWSRRQQHACFQHAGVQQQPGPSRTSLLG